MNNATADKQTDALDLANELRPVLLRLTRHLRRELAPLGITAGQAALLHAIDSGVAVGVRELAEGERISRPRVTAAVNRLESMGLVTRTRSDVDGRRVELAVTPEGRRILRSARRRRTAWLAARLGQLDVAERESVADALPALERLLEVRP
jgi:DNA-binding MarR family transcriptional regulator